MTDEMTKSTELSAAITFKVQAKVLENLRADLFYANESMAEQGDFDQGTDSLLFTNVPDLAKVTTPLTEGVTPDRRKLTMGTVSVDTEQYGDLVSISDVAKAKSPIQIVDIGSERVTRASLETIDQVNRDVIAGGGTVAYAGGATSRDDVALADDKLTVANLRKFAWRMFKASIPRHSDGFYHLAVSAEVAYDLGEDDDFVEAYKYTDNMPLLQNEIGKIAGFRIQEVVNAPTFTNVGSVVVHASIATGAPKGWGAGELSTMETYHIAPGGDHSDPLAQEELIGWKVNFGVAVLSNARYFRIESAATVLS